MKIGIISINMYSKGLNFACPIHTFAFQQFLLSHGIDCAVINYTPVYFDNFNLRHPSDYYEKLIEQKLQSKPDDEKKLDDWQKKIGDYQKKADSWKKLYHERESRYDKLQQFIDKYYIKTDICYNSDLLELEDPGFDCYICATDVIWKNQPGYGFDRGFFLGSSCMEQKWKLAYSASRGVYLAEKEEDKRLFFHYLEDFDAISVREKSLKDYIEENSELHVEQTLDPVLLQDASFYEKILIKPKEEHYVLLYYVMEKANDTIRAAVLYAKKHHLQIIEITDNAIEGGKASKLPECSCKCTFRFDIGIEEWLGYIRYADCIFTNSFHGTCFSILFEKDFYVGFRKNDKVRDLLSLLGLEKRYLNLYGDDDFISKIKHKLNLYVLKYLPSFLSPRGHIKYNKVRKNLEEKRQESSDFILSAIQSCEESERPVKDYDTFKRSLTYPVLYNGNYTESPLTWDYSEKNGAFQKFNNGMIEYREKGTLYQNDGKSQLKKNGYHQKGYKFIGWNLRFRIDTHMFWILNNGTYIDVNEYQPSIHGEKRLFSEEETIPFLPVNHIAVMVAEAVWQKNKV